MREKHGSIFLVVQSMFHSSETEPGGHPGLFLYLQICDQNKFIFFINGIASNILVQQGKKKSNTMPVAGTVPFSTPVPNI